MSLSYLYRSCVNWNISDELHQKTSPIDSEEFKVVSGRQEQAKSIICSMLNLLPKEKQRSALIILLDNVPCEFTKLIEDLLNQF